MLRVRVDGRETGRRSRRCSVADGAQHVVAAILRLRSTLTERRSLLLVSNSTRRRFGITLAE